MAHSVELVITRTFDAPQERVFRAFTDPDHLKHWWGPKEWEIHVVRFDLRPDGVFHYYQQDPGGQVMWGKWVFREIMSPEKLVFVNSFSDEDGRTIRAPFNANWPLEILNSLTFTEQEGKTVLTMRGVPHSPTEEELKTFVELREPVKQGFAGTFDQLDEFLARQQG